ncbi:MAG TPA: ABC transporter substrate-binding protein [Candidatus Limnocylindria bacterium]
MRVTRRRFLGGVAAAGVGAAFAAACEPVTAPAASPSGAAVRGGAAGPETVVTSGVADVQTLNPILASDGSSQVAWELMFESLVVADPKAGTPTPWLAERWDRSADGLTYTFRLRPNVTWHDGRPFTSDDVKFTFDTILDPKIQTALRSRLDGVASTEAPDPATFRMRLKEAACPTLISAMVVPIVPKHLLASSPDFNKDAFGSSKPVGTGPFTFTEWVRDDHVTLTANAGYWRGKPKVGRMIRKVVKDNVVAAAQLRSGELDWAIVQPESFDDLRSDPHLNVIQYGNSTVNYIAYNLDRPLFQDKRVRQALAYGLDRESLIKTLFNGQGDVLHSPILTFSWAYNANVPKYGYDPERAKRLLADAGWSAGADGILRKGGLPLRFGLATNAGNKAREGVLTIAQDQWRKIGIDVQQQLLQLNAINDKLQKTRDFDAVLAQLVPGVDPDQTSFWSSKEFPAGQNYAHYSDPTVDQLLAQGRTVAGCDESARKSIYDRLQLSLAEDQPVTLLYQPVTLIAHDRRLRGIAPTPYARPQWNFAEWNWGA